MSNLKTKLIDELRKIDGVEDRPSPVAGGTALFYHGKEFAHFDNENELDLRLTKKVIKRLGMTHPTDSKRHPNRSPNFPWIVIRFNDPGDIENISRLVKLAVAEL
jgi:hypothetical protein